MEIQDIIISAFVTIFSLGLIAVSFASFRKYKNPKLLFVNLVFFVFLVKGILLSLSLFIGDIAVITTMPFSGLFDLIILIFLFIATLKR